MAFGRHHTDPRKVEQVMRWREANAERVKEAHRLKRIRYKARRNERRRTIPQVRIAENLRIRLVKVLRGSARRGSAVGLLGCTVEALVAHVERQFLPRMAWANWGDVWQLDHIRPLAGFDLTDPAQLAQACHFTNLMPLAKAANRAKGAKALYLL